MAFTQTALVALLALTGMVAVQGADSTTYAHSLGILCITLPLQLTSFYQSDPAAVRCPPSRSKHCSTLNAYIREFLI